MKVFVTVGTTKFDDLISEICLIQSNPTFSDYLFTIQHGNSPLTQPSTNSFNFKPSIQPYIREADIIITAGGSGTIGQGYAGGGNTSGAGGGGGGAGGVGQAATAGSGGVGAICSLITTAQSTTYAVGQINSGYVYFAGGGGGGWSSGYGTNNGGAGALGGGGNGAQGGANGSDGTANTGGGAGGAGFSGSDFQGGTGGSGVFIIRYSVA